MIWRAAEDMIGFLEGSCISEENYKKIIWFRKCLFEPISEIERQSMIEHKHEKFCSENAVECLLFYSKEEVGRFAEKIKNSGYN